MFLPSLGRLPDAHLGACDHSPSRRATPCGPSLNEVAHARRLTRRQAASASADRRNRVREIDHGAAHVEMPHGRRRRPQPS